VFWNMIVAEVGVVDIMSKDRRDGKKMYDHAQECE
jgi:hypothetical protein